MKEKRIGFVGLGTMGWPMAHRLYEAGYTLMVHNRTAAKAQDFVRQHPGTRAAAELEQIAQVNHVVITMLPDSDDIANAVFSARNGMLDAIHPRTLVIDMSSTLPRVAVTVASGLAAKKADFLDAPVSGSRPRAEDGTLSIMVGGKPDVFERAKPILEVLGTPELMGPCGEGQRVKLGNQIEVASNLVSLAVKIVSLEKSGADIDAAIHAWQRGLARTEVTERKAAMMRSRTFVPAQFKAHLHLKDLNNAVEDLKYYQKASPEAVAVVVRLRNLFQKLIDKGFGDEDHSAIIRVLE